MSIAYSRYYERIDQLFEDTRALVNSLALPDAQKVLSAVNSSHQHLRAETPIRIALIGEFDAGKSSIISALTGEDLYIDADVATTRISEYPWKGLLLVDTPGVQAKSADTEHDAIARAATIRADLVLFVITNELFNPRLAEHLDFVLSESGLGLSGKTSIIVNKIDREANPVENLVEEITKALKTHQNVSVYFCSASKYLQARKETSPLRERFERQSLFTDLIHGIDEFIDDAGGNGRLSTPLSVISAALDEIQPAIAQTEGDKNKMELIRRQRVVLQRLHQRLSEIKKTWKQKAYSTVLSRANEAVEGLSETSTATDLENLFEAGLKEVDADLDHVYEGLEIEICESMQRASAELEEIGNSPIGKQVEKLEMHRADTVTIQFSGKKPSDSFIASKLGRAAAKPLEDALKTASENAKKIRDIYYEVGKALGTKFKPWQATKAGGKIAKILGKFGKAVPVFTFLLDVYLQYCEEKSKEEKQRYLANLRMALRGAFIEQGRAEAETLEKTVVEVSRGPVQGAINELNKQENQIIANTEKAEAFQTEIAKIRHACTQIRDEIYSGQT